MKVTFGVTIMKYGSMTVDVPNELIDKSDTEIRKYITENWKKLDKKIFNEQDVPDSEEADFLSHWELER